MDIIAQHDLHFYSTTETGTVFHLIGCLSEFGKVGLTSIGNSHQEAEILYKKVIRALDQESKAHIDSDSYLPAPTFMRNDISR
jgi:hypothetical protein